MAEKREFRDIYSQEITRKHRAAIVIAIDQSSSMSGGIELQGCNISKAEAVSMVTGQLIDELIMRSYRDGNYRHYYDIALIGYSQDRVYSLLGDRIAFYPITGLAGRNVARTSYRFPHNTMEKGICYFTEEISMWVEPRAEGATPMYKMLNCVTELVEEWCSKEENSESFPPLIFNVTDGEVSDGSEDMLRSAALRLRKSGTKDGNSLFMNIHISSDSSHKPILFPTPCEVPLAIRYAHLLMDMSSVLPEPFNQYVKECRQYFAQPPYIAMSYNASMSELVAMLNIGTRSLTIGL